MSYRIGLTAAFAAVVLLLVGGGLLASTLLSAFDFGGSDSSDFSGSPATGMWSTVAVATTTLALCGAAVACFWFRRTRHQALVHDLGAGSFTGVCAQRFSDRSEHRVNQIAQAQNGNVVLYSTHAAEVFDTSFVGSGELIDGWQFALALRPVGESSRPSPFLTSQDVGVRRATDSFSTVAVYERVRAALAHLSSEKLAADERLSGLSLRDRLYVDGQLDPSSRFLADGVPLARVSTQIVDEVRERPRGRERHHLVARVASWAG